MYWIGCVVQCINSLKQRAIKKYTKNSIGPRTAEHSRTQQQRILCCAQLNKLKRNKSESLVWDKERGGTVDVVSFVVVATLVVCYLSRCLNSYVSLILITLAGHRNVFIWIPIRLSLYVPFGVRQLLVSSTRSIDRPSNRIDTGLRDNKTWTAINRYRGSMLILQQD